MPVVGSGGASTTAGDLIEETKRLLLSGHREQMNRLAAAVSAGASELTFDFALNGIQAGAIIGVDLELFYVWEVNEEAKSATVEGGWLGSTEASHADSAIVTVNPKFSDFSILKSLNAELADLSSPNNGLFQIKTTTLTYNASIRGYDLTNVDDLIAIADVRYDASGTANDWPQARRWSVIHNADTTDFASGKALVVDGAEAGRTIRVSYRAPFVALSAKSDNVESASGLPDTAHDILPLGAAIRLIAPREVKRSFDESQGDSRRAEEVPAGANLNSLSGLARLRRDRITAEAGRLAANWPTRLRV